MDLQQNRDVPHLVACDPFANIYEKLDCISQLGTITSRQSPGSGWKNIASVVTVKPKECQPAKKGEESKKGVAIFSPFPLQPPMNSGSPPSSVRRSLSPVPSRYHKPRPRIIVA